jgi:phosphotransferase system  glucose/maltose/N-acetylglucosamine-specific IIC component
MSANLIYYFIRDNNGLHQLHAISSAFLFVHIICLLYIYIYFFFLSFFIFFFLKKSIDVSVEKGEKNYLLIDLGEFLPSIPNSSIPTL